MTASVFCALLFFWGPFVAQDAPPPGMVEIPAGEYWMGRVRMWLIDELQMYLRLRQDDQPAHLVHIDKFFIDVHEVTNQGYAKFVEATKHRVPFHWKGGNVPQGQESHPAYNVSWDDADAYCKWAGKRLPTEAEWEKAARGGTEKTMYPWGDQLSAGRGGRGSPPAPKRAHYGLPNGPTKVGSYEPNGFGMYDVVGNVAEWVNDWYYRTYYSVTPEANPKGPETGMYKVFRGSSWADTDERMIGLHYRNYTNAEHRTNVIGFRCAK
jgi:iron(II)-dependent oxidoreductase